MYVIDGLQVFIESVKDIAAGEEIFVDYGKEYWDVMLKNKKIDEKAAKEAAKKKK